MDPTTFKTIQPLLDRIAEIVDKQLGTSGLLQALSDLSRALGDQLAVSINVTVDVFDEAKEEALPLLTTGLSTDANRQLYRTWGDSSPQRYVAADGIRVVPHDRCPKCWGVWDFKFQNRSCAHCGTTLGRDCKILLDTDECPWCQEGKVTMARPRCDKCGFVVDQSIATWG